MIAPLSAGPETSARRGVTENPLSRLAAMAVMGLATIYFLFPIWWLFVSSTKDRGQFTSTNPMWFADWALWDNVKAVLTYRDGVYLQWILNSLLYTIGGALIGTVLAGMCGYALAKYRFRGREALFNIVLGGVLVPATALALPLFLIFSRVELTNTFWAVFPAEPREPVRRLPDPDLLRVVGPRRAARGRAPRRLGRGPHLLHDVGAAHGAGARHRVPVPVRRDLEQLLPAADHAAGRVALPVTLGIYTWNTQVNQIPELRGYVLVGALLSVVPLIALFLLLQRFWRNGLGAGSIK